MRRVDRRQRVQPGCRRQGHAVELLQAARELDIDLNAVKHPNGATATPRRSTSQPDRSSTVTVVGSSDGFHTRICSCPPVRVTAETGTSSSGTSGQMPANISWLTWGRLRPVHVMGVVFGAFSSAIVGLTYYMVPRLCGVRMYKENWSRALVWIWNIGLTGALVSLPLGQNIGIEAGEFEELADPTTSTRSQRAAITFTAD